MAILTMQPIGPSPTPTAHEDLRRAKVPAEDGDDFSDLDSGWVVLENSDIVPADLAAACGGQGLRSSPTLPSWARWVLGGVVCTVVPIYKRVRYLEEETVGIVENGAEVVEHIAEVTEKLSTNAADKLPEDGSLQKAVEKVEDIAEIVDNDAEKVEAIAEKIGKVCDKIDAAVEPVIDELEKELDGTPPSDNAVNSHN